MDGAHPLELPLAGDSLFSKCPFCGYWRSWKDSAPDPGCLMCRLRYSAARKRGKKKKGWLEFDMDDP